MLVYAYVEDEGKKRATAMEIVDSIFDGTVEGFVSNQILAEFSYVMSRKYMVSASDLKAIASGIAKSEKWHVVNYGPQTVVRTLERMEIHKDLPFFDLLIAETMKENLITHILTENEEDFGRIPGIKVTNPFK